MLRAYIREIPGLSAERQRELAIATGIKDSALGPIYTEGKNSFPAERRHCLDSFRKRGEILVVGRLAVLASNRHDLIEVWAEIDRLGIVVLESETMRRSDDPSVTVMMVVDCFNYWASRNRTYSNRKAAAAAGSKGGKAAAARRRKARMPKNLAIEIWRDKALDNEAAIAKMNADPAYTIEWTESTAYRVLGPRGAFAGRRGNRRRDA